MSYSIRFRSRSKVQATELKQDYGQNFVQAFDDWLALLAEAAEKRDTAYSVDGLELLRRLGNPDALTQWKYSWRKLKRASFRERFEALLTTITKRCPPWEFRCSTKWFTLLDLIPHEIQVYYMVDHTRKWIIFEKFELGDSERTDHDVID